MVGLRRRCPFHLNYSRNCCRCCLIAVPLLLSQKHVGIGVFLSWLNLVVNPMTTTAMNFLLYFRGAAKCPAPAWNRLQLCDAFRSQSPQCRVASDLQRAPSPRSTSSSLQLAIFISQPPGSLSEISVAQREKRIVPARPLERQSSRPTPRSRGR